MVEDREWAHVEAELRRLAAGDRFSGSVRVSRGEEVLLACGAGTAERGTGTPVTPHTRFGLASLSKMFTAAAVLACVRDGLLVPGDRVVDLVPPERRPRTMAEEVTVHHLLTHTSGIGDYAEEDEDVESYVEDYGSLWADRPSYRMERPRDYLPLYADTPPVMAPGARFHYSNAGYVLLGQVLEEVTGRPVAEAITQLAMVPAGMSESGFFRLDEALPDLATAYLPREHGEPWRSNVFSIPVVGSGDGGAFATTRDVDRFLRAVGTGRLLGDEVSALMRTPHVPVEAGYSMGYGLLLREDGSLGHGGGDPGVETLARHWPDRDLTLVVLCNQEGGLDPVWELLLTATA